MRINLLILLFALSATINLSAQTSRETRAVWISSNFQLDWPPASYDETAQKLELIKIFKNIKNKKLNTIYFQVRSSGTVMFESSYEPYSKYLTGKTGGKPAYDPLSFAIEQAHKRGLEIHAWVNVFKCYSGTDLETAAHSWHVIKKHPNWVVKYWKDGKVTYWLDPGMPEVRQYLLDVITELTANYDLDGLQLDFIRYPGGNFDDEFTYSAYAEGSVKDDWRRDNVNHFIHELNIAVKRIKPEIKIGAAPLGIYEDIEGAVGLEGFSDVFQDSRKWAEEGWVDYLTPQIYWGADQNPRFDKLAADWIQNKFGRNIILGIGAYKPEVKAEMDELIKLSRALNAEGVAFYRYSNIKNYFFEDFKERTFPSEMSWLDGVKPNPPKNLSVSYPQGSIDEFILNWDAPDPSKNGAKIEYYAVYKVNGNMKLFELFKADKTAVRLKIKNPEFVKFSFALKSLDRLWNESTGSSDTVSVSMPALNSIAGGSEPFDKPLLIKENEHSYSILLFSYFEQQIDISAEDEFGIISIFNFPLEKGKNVLPLDTNGNKLLKIIVKFSSDGREVTLSI